MWLFTSKKEISTESLDILEQESQPWFVLLTFCKTICRRITIDDDVIFDEKVSLTAGELRRKRQDIGMIFQHFNLMSQKNSWGKRGFCP